MLRLITRNLSEAALCSHKSSVVHFPHSALWSHAAPLSVMCQKENSRQWLLKSSHPLRTLAIPNQCVFHTSTSKYNIQDELFKRVKFMYSEVDWKKAKSSPQPALVLGAAGLVPFVMTPIFIVLNGEFLPNLALAQLAYGATILSFLGGVKWGFSVPEHTAQKLTYRNLGWSVSLPLIGWCSLILPPWLGTLTLIGGLGSSTYVDITAHGYPEWFKALRLCLSTVAIGGLSFTFLLRLVS